jgi:DNA-binding LacI/PurR family transcriptional regulator
MRESRADPARRTTIYDIAKLAETSASAVSSILNGSWQKRRISQRLADKVMQIAEREGYSANAQASLLRRSRSNIVGMIVPKYDNRYFGAIAEQFEAIARERGLFPVVTCTQREPALEVEAAKELISFRAECLIATGATDPDHLTSLCKAAGVRSINLDLPGHAAPSVISDNYTGARDLTRILLDRCERDLGLKGPLHFVGGRRSDHNTAARLQGFREAHGERGLVVPDSHVLVPGYSADKAEQAMKSLLVNATMGLFVNSTISLEGVVRWFQGLGGAHPFRLRYGCFDFDPFAALLPGNVGMVQQDTMAMLHKVFDLLDNGQTPSEPIMVPCILKRSA